MASFGAHDADKTVVGAQAESAVTVEAGCDLDCEVCGPGNPARFHMAIPIGIEEPQVQRRRHDGAAVGMGYQRVSDSLEDQVCGDCLFDSGPIKDGQGHRCAFIHWAKAARPSSELARPMPMRNRSVGVAVSSER